MLSAVFGLVGLVAGVGLVTWGAVIRRTKPCQDILRAGAATPGGTSLNDD
jgi:hypothetical protein